MFFYVCGYLWKGAKWLKVHEIDVDSGRRELDWEAHEKMKQEIASWPAWRRVLNKLF